MQYNEFHLRLKARNEYEIDGLNTGEVQILVSQQSTPYDSFPLVYLFLLGALALLSVLGLVLDYGCKKSDKPQQRKQVDFKIEPKSSFPRKIGRNSMQLEENAQNEFAQGEERLLNLAEMNNIITDKRAQSSPKFKF